MTCERSQVKPWRLQTERTSLALAQYIAEWGPSAVHSSPRHRALSVAETASELAGVPLHINEGLAEISFGAAEGMTYDEAGIEFLKGLRAVIDARIERRSKTKARGQAISIE